MHLLAKTAPNLDPKAPPISEPSSSVPSGRLRASSATLPAPPKSEPPGPVSDDAADSKNKNNEDQKASRGESTSESKKQPETSASLNAN
jgi:hypothetical protein